MSTFAQIQYRVYVGWETSLAGTLRFDISKFDGGDVFANAFTNFFTGALDEVTSDYSNASIVRGRDALLGPIQSGTFDFTLTDPMAQVGYYDPSNSGSPLAALSPGFVPMRPVKVTATVNGTVYPRYYGFIRTANYDPDSKSCVVHCEDLILWLSRVKPVVSTLSNTTDQAIIGAILDAIQWNDPAMRRLSAYTDPITTYSRADGSAFATSLITDVLAANRGVFYANAAGVAVSEDRAARSRRTSALTTFTSSQITVSKNNTTSGVNLDLINNEETITGADSVPETVSVATSQQKFGIGEIDDVSSSLIPNSAIALGRAQWDVAISAANRPPYVFQVDPDALEQVFQLDLQDRFAISGGSAAGDYHLERIVEPIGIDAASKGVELTASKRGVVGFTFDHSTFDGPDIFAAA